MRSLQRGGPRRANASTPNHNPHRRLGSLTVPNPTQCTSMGASRWKVSVSRTVVNRLGSLAAPSLQSTHPRLCDGVCSIRAHVLSSGRQSQVSTLNSWCWRASQQPNDWERLARCPVVGGHIRTDWSSSSVFGGPVANLAERLNTELTPQYWTDLEQESDQRG